MTDFLAKVANKRELAAVLSWLRREHEWTSLVSDALSGITVALSRTLMTRKDCMC